MPLIGAGLVLSFTPYRLTTLCLPPDQGHFVFHLVAMILTKTNREHSFDVELAEIHGIQKAVLLKNFDYWVRENERKQIEQFFVGGKYWTSESASSLANKYRYMPKSSIKRWVNELQDIGWLDILKFQSDTSFYRPGKVFELWNTGQDWQSAQNEPTKKNEHWPKMSQALAQNEPKIGPIRADNWPTVSHNNIDLNVEVNIDSNIEKSGAQPQNDFSPFAAAPETNTPPNSAAPPRADFENQAAFTVATYEQAETPNGPVFVASRVPLATQTPKAKSKKAPAEITPEQIAAHLQPSEQGFFAQVIANGAWADYQEYRMGLDRFKYKDAKSAAAGIRGMFTATAGNADNAQTVVDQSRANGWKGVFPLKNNNSNARPYQSGNNSTSDFYGGPAGSFTGGIRRD